MVILLIYNLIKIIQAKLLLFLINLVCNNSKSKFKIIKLFKFTKFEM